jgi:hypothetical protein
VGSCAWLYHMHDSELDHPKGQEAPTIERQPAPHREDGETFCLAGLEELRASKLP